MIAFYIQGGGLGHLSRSAKIVNALGIPKDKVLWITPSHFTSYFSEFQIHPLSATKDPGQLQLEIAHLFTAKSITHCYVDAFPAGLYGELNGLAIQCPTIKWTYIARILRWETYSLLVKENFDITFEKTYVLETLYTDHEIWISQVSIHVQTLTLPPVSIVEPKRPLARDYELLIHSGGKEDVERLVAFAQQHRDPKLPVFIATQIRLDHLPDRFYYLKGSFPALPYVEKASKVYTACGFNLMHELRPFANKQHCLPLERLYDDQKFRYARFKEQIVSAH